MVDDALRAQVLVQHVFLQQRTLSSPPHPHPRRRTSRNGWEWGWEFRGGPRRRYWTGTGSGSGIEHGRIKVWTGRRPKETRPGYDGPVTGLGRRDGP